MPVPEAISTLRGWQQSVDTLWNSQQGALAELAGAAGPAGVQAVTTPADGGWTPEIGNAIADRAQAWAGSPYSWAGGDRLGPTLGRTDGGDASRYDDHIVGFDCSGLTLYALHPWRTVSHFAADQYLQAGEYHPPITGLQRGDLVFWSSDGTQRGIHHVAIYAGDGNVIQAPQSGDVVKVTPLSQVAKGYFGATRPLT
jgi:cell wall-associated NlpC family hydrolase